MLHGYFIAFDTTIITCIQKVGIVLSSFSNKDIVVKKNFKKKDRIDKRKFHQVVCRIFYYFLSYQFDQGSPAHGIGHPATARKNPRSRFCHESRQVPMLGNQWGKEI